MAEVVETLHREPSFMDHLPFGISHAIEPVPLMADIDPETSPTNHNFHTFPEHSGWSLQADGDLTANFPNYRRSHSTSKFVQRWLFFEVLREVLGGDESFSYQDFTRFTDDGKSVICTSELPGYLKRWQTRVRGQNPIEKKRHLVRVQDVLDQAKSLVSKYCSVRAVEDNPVWLIDWLVALSFNVLGETLTRAMIKIQVENRFEIRGWTTREQESKGWGYSMEVLKQLKRRNCCLKTIHMLLGLLRDNTIGLLCALREHSPLERHHTCGLSNCEGSTESTFLESKYKLFHEDSCEKTTCWGRGPESARLCAIIDADNVPIFTYSRQNNQAFLEIHAMHNYNRDYAIFSHVWADGFGNPDANKLNTCVLDSFQGLFAMIEGFRQRRGEPRVDGFWIDTLAIPVGRNYTNQRKRAIQKMHDIYRHAKYTVVLDAGLMKAIKEERYASTATKIMMSQWMTRLWTLQEAVLSEDLYFRFSDQVYSLKQLEEQFRREDRELHDCTAAVAHWYWYGILGEERPRYHPSERPHDDHDAQRYQHIDDVLIARLWKATQWRRTEHPQHETLALATLLNLSTQDFTDSANTASGFARKPDLEDRMQRFIDLLSRESRHSIPPGIIFLPGQKLSHDGYRWAPLSWLSRASTFANDQPDLLTTRKCLPATLNPPHGLEVRFPGFELHDLGGWQKTLSLRNDFHFPTDKSLSEWYWVGMMDRNVLFPSEQQLASRRLAIITASLPILTPKEVASLVAISDQRDDALEVETLSFVWLSRETRPDILQRLRHVFQADALHEMPLGQQLPADQRWWVDGPASIHGEPQDQNNDQDPGSSSTRRLLMGIVKRLHRSPALKA
ncbi:hypothetical protein MMC20_000303 [Loxospora ochrophaea]|nr:hypothetical protein [Loxospora ochrophaea]